MTTGVRATDLKSFIEVTYSFIGTGIIFEVFQKKKKRTLVVFYHGNTIIILVIIL